MPAKRLPYGPIDHAALTRFEGQLSGPLPRGLRQFLLEWNGAVLSDARELEDVAGGTALQEIFGLHTGPEYLRLDHMSRQMAGSIPESILVFAADAYGNYFGISLSGVDSGAVYFIDHETMSAARDSMIPVADTFAAFLERSGCHFVAAPAATKIAEAIDSGDNGALTHLLAAGADATGVVHHAVRHGDLRILETVLRQTSNCSHRGACCSISSSSFEPSGIIGVTHADKAMNNAATTGGVYLFRQKSRTPNQSCRL